MQTSANPILVQGIRGEMVESLFRGAFAVCTPQGQVVFSEGNCNRLIYPRSSLKLLQALALHISGAYKAYSLSLKHLAVACSSHNGEKEHLQLIEAWLQELGLTPCHLECGPHYPLGKEASKLLKNQQITPTSLHNTCSGKHTGFLTINRFLGHDVLNYTHKDHPTQKFINDVISQICEYDVSASPQGIDGCQAPVLSMSLTTLATAMAKLSDPMGLSAPFNQAATCVVESIQTHPFLVAGSDRFCTDIAHHTKGEIVVKMGADGVFSALLPAKKLGIALKIDDGHMRAAEVALMMILDRLYDPLPAALLKYKEQPILNWNKKTVGKYTQALYT